MFLEYKSNYIWWDATCIHTNNMDLKGLKTGAAASPAFDLVTYVSVVALQGTVTLDPRSDINKLRGIQSRNCTLNSSTGVLISP